MMSDNGLAASSLVLIILAIVSGGVMILVAVQISSENQLALEENCRSSVLQRIAVDSVPVLGAFSDYSSLRCSSFDEGTISGSRVEVKKDIADLTARCWYMYGEGRSVSVFEDTSVNSCVICYTFNLDEDIGAYEFGERRKIFDETGIQPDMESEVDSNNPKRETFTLDGEEVIRERFLGSNMIPHEEMYNFLMNNRYNPSLIRGGAIGDYMSAYYDFEYEVEEGGIGVTLLNADLENGVNEYVFDYTDEGDIGASVAPTFETLGSQLIEEGNGQLYVLIADSFSSTTKGAVNTFIEGKSLNTPGSKDAVVILVDLEEGFIRVSIGKDLERFITEPVLQNEVDMLFTDVYSQSQLEDNLFTLGNSLTAILQFDDENDAIRDLGLDNSYFSYISNRGVHMPIIADIDQHRIMGVAFGAEGHGFLSSSQRNGIVAAGTIVGGTAGLLTGIFGTGGTLATPLTFAGGIGGATGTNELLNIIEGENPVDTNVIIGPMSELSEECERV